MEFRTLTGLVLETSEDEVWNITFAKVLTEEGLETLKIPSLLKDFKQGHSIKPNNLIQIEVVKTKKNWIIKNINRTYSWCQPSSFSDYLKLTKLLEFLSKSIKVGETTNCLKFIINYFSNKNLEHVDTDHFQVSFLTYMGYGGELTHIA